MNIGIIGDGAIGRYVRARLAATHVIVVRGENPGRRATDAIPRVSDVSDLPEDTDLMIDCAGHAALGQHGPAILERGIKLVTVSLGALADPDLRSHLRSAAETGGTRLYLASGAIGALDCLRAARVGGLDRVAYIGRKPPEGWRGSPAENVLDLDSMVEAKLHFDGDARRAAAIYPKNANVAAAVALAGLGFEATGVKLIADPNTAANVHEVHASGEFGSFSFRIEGRALPDSPRSSALAAMSVVAAIERQREVVVI